MSDDSDSESAVSGLSGFGFGSPGSEDESPYAQNGGGANEAPDPANSDYIGVDGVDGGEADPTTKVYEENDVDEEEFGGFGVFGDEDADSDEAGVTVVYGGDEAGAPRGSSSAKAAKAASLAKNAKIPLAPIQQKQIKKKKWNGLVEYVTTSDNKTYQNLTVVGSVVAVAAVVSVVAFGLGLGLGLDRRSYTSSGQCCCFSMCCPTRTRTRTQIAPTCACVCACACARARVRACVRCTRAAGSHPL